MLEVKLDDTSSEFCEDYYLLKVKPSTCAQPPGKEGSEPSSRRSSIAERGDKKVEGFFLKAGPLVKLDPDFISDLTNIANESKSNWVKRCHL